MTNVAINGMGRIGRATFKILLETPGLEVVAVNDIVPIDNIAYLLRYDTVYGRYSKTVEVEGDDLVVDRQRYRKLSERDPAELPWDELDIDIVLECTGRFTAQEDVEKHLQAGARAAILSAPSKGNELPTVVLGSIEPDISKGRLMSVASCTTNAITPVVEIIDRRLGVEKAVMTTIHGYTASQALVDTAASKRRRGRAAAANLVPTTTGAAVATGAVLPNVQGRFDGVAVRAPVPAGSIADIIMVTRQETTVEEVNSILIEEAGSERYQGIFGVTDDGWVSSDVIGDSRAAIADTEMTIVIQGNLVKIMSWYDNEWGFCSQMVRATAEVAKQLEAE